MALFATRPFADAVLGTRTKAVESEMHVFEPEFHQDVYRLPGELAAQSELGAFQMVDDLLVRPINRGKQPTYADDLDDPDSLAFIGLLSPEGTRLTEVDTPNIAALKSVSIRGGYVDIDAARSVSPEYFEKNGPKSGVKKNDVLINSTGDGTIGRVAVYHYDFPAIVDGHVSIIRFKDPTLAWYTAAYLQTVPGQHQIYRYINGSSGQVEIYPQDLERLQIPRKDDAQMKSIGDSLRNACESFSNFRTLLGSTVARAAR